MRRDGSDQATLRDKCETPRHKRMHGAVKSVLKGADAYGDHNVARRDHN